MAFGGYEVTRSNIFNANTHDVSGVWWDEKEAINAARIFARENKSGDVIIVWATETESNSTIACSVFNHPEIGLVVDSMGDVDMVDMMIEALDRM